MPADKFIFRLVQLAGTNRIRIEFPNADSAESAITLLTTGMDSFAITVLKKTHIEMNDESRYLLKCIAGYVEFVEDSWGSCFIESKSNEVIKAFADEMRQHSNFIESDTFTT